MLNNKDIAASMEAHVKNKLNISGIKITDLALEELINFSFIDAGYKTLYTCGSHGTGKDITIISETNYGFSIKSGIENKKNELRISSYRLSRFEDDLNKMTEFIDNDSSNFDYYMILARPECNTNVLKYKCYMLPSNIFKASDVKWNEKYSKNNKLSGWKSNNEHFLLEINKSQSSQLWITINTDYISKYLLFEIETPIKEVAKERFKFKKQ